MPEPKQLEPGAELPHARPKSAPTHPTNPVGVIFEVFGALRECPTLGLTNAIVPGFSLEVSIHS